MNKNYSKTCWQLQAELLNETDVKNMKYGKTQAMTCRIKIKNNKLIQVNYD